MEKKKEKKEEDSDRQQRIKRSSVSPPADRNAVMVDTVPCMVWSELIVTFLY